LLEDWGRNILGQLLGDKDSVKSIIDLLSTKAKIVFPEAQNIYINDPTGWGTNYDIADKILSKYTNLNIKDFPFVEFPQGTMFWARTACLSKFLALPLNWEDFPKEPISSDGTLAHALERLVLIFALDHPGLNYRLVNGDVNSDKLFYEPICDFSDRIVENDIKILSYYLPQFHPIPENDEWHGAGFTEWTKVRSSNPLFYGHYQQHIPHSDIGYYLLDSPETLKQQSELMRSAGVYGQVFYHYWFSGRLILEEPAQMLLADKSIEMNFCFCWANENWTRRWDGDDQDILLGQEYTENDARAFIRYLLPFFSDSRYIKIEGKPVLFVYRPSSLPDHQTYVEAWRQECEIAGLPSPYLVAVLTRGAVHPKDFHFDAGVERVLHDWTGGHVDDIKNKLSFFDDFNGSVLPYTEVADYYMRQKDIKEFTYFRSLVPIWDNTARYRDDAYVIHGSTPEKFQQWLESSITYTNQSLERDKRFIVINAWNEWAEGAHLEPDSYFGYSYLNSVGRALAKIPYKNHFTTEHINIIDISIYIEFPDHLIAILESDVFLKNRFLHFYKKSTIFKIPDVKISSNIILGLPFEKINNNSQSANAVSDFILTVRWIALISENAIEEMVKLALANTGSCILSNTYDSQIDLRKLENNLSTSSSNAFNSALILTPFTHNGTFKLSTQAKAFVSTPNYCGVEHLPKVTTVVRFHSSSSIDELKHAMLCLYAMHACEVTPMIMAQDVDEVQKSQLDIYADSFIGSGCVKPIIKYYKSNIECKDLRSKMLNEGLRCVRTRYASILDYDDLLTSDAFHFLIDRMTKTNKAVSFGRVFKTDCDTVTGQLLCRHREFEYNYSYEEFINKNHAPIHSFLLDMQKLDLSKIKYYDDHKYMEDYYLTLQLFTADNTDWNGLHLNRYIGDYIHSINRSHTLALQDHESRRLILADIEYIKCEERICEIRSQLAGGAQ
jgi:lipopolysaccharide biosynthesis protein